MNLFWDTSALLSLVIEEQESASACCAWERSDADYAWRWLTVEAASGLARRRANPGQWNTLQELLACIRYVDMDPEELPAMCRENRRWALRAADAGHVQVFRKMAGIMPDLAMVCFDREMRAVAERLGLPLWGAAGGAAGHQFRESRSPYGRGRRKGRP